MTYRLGDSRYSPCPEVMQRLLSAAKVGNHTTVKGIIDDNRGNPYVRPTFNQALLLSACFGHFEIVKLLLQAKAEVNYSDSSGMRAIHHAATSGNVETTKLLLNAGSPVNNTDGDGYTPLHHAIQSGHGAVVALLVKEGAGISRPKCYKEGKAPIHLAARRGRTDMMHHILSKATDLGVLTKEERETPLHLAIKGRHFGVVIALCNAGANFDQINKDGETPLHVAVSNSSIKCVQILLEYGADPTQADQRGRTPLHLAAGLSIGTTSSEITTLLINFGRSVNYGDFDGYTPLHFTASLGNVEVAKQLIDAGACLDVYAVGKGGDTPLNLAISYGRDEMVRLLVEAGADVAEGNASHLTPLHQVPSSRLTDKIGLTDLILRHGAKVNARCKNGSSPLDRCVFTNVLGRKSCQSTLYRIVGAGAKLEKNHQSGGSQLRTSGLCWLTWHGELTIATFLVNSGWDITSEPWIGLQGKTPEIEDFLVWLRELVHEPRPLKVICRSTIRGHLKSLVDDRDIVPLIEELPIPNLTKRILTLETEIKHTESEDGSR